MLKRVKRKEPSYTVGGNVNWCSHYGEQCGVSEHLKQNYHTTQQSHYWAYIQRKPRFKRYMHPSVHCSIIHNSQDTEAT